MPDTTPSATAGQRRPSGRRRSWCASSNMATTTATVRFSLIVEPSTATSVGSSATMTAAASPTVGPAIRRASTPVIAIVAAPGTTPARRTDVEPSPNNVCQTAWYRVGRGEARRRDVRRLEQRGRGDEPEAVTDRPALQLVPDHVEARRHSVDDHQHVGHAHDDADQDDGDQRRDPSPVESLLGSMSSAGPISPRHRAGRPSARVRHRCPTARSSGGRRRRRAVLLVRPTPVGSS